MSKDARKETAAGPSWADGNTIGKILCLVLFKFALCVYFLGQMMERVTQHAYFSISETSVNNDSLNDSEAAEVVSEQHEAEPPQKSE